MVFATLSMDEDYEEDAAVFAYNTTRVALIVLFKQITGFVLHPREGVDAPLLTAVDKIPPDIQGLEKILHSQKSPLD